MPRPERGPLSRWTRTHSVVAATTAAVFAGGAVVLGVIREEEPTPSAPRPASVTPSPTAAPAPMRTAEPVDPLTGTAVVDGPVLAVKVENIGAARPQVGLDVADIVFVQRVEGAQTRLVAVYHTRFPSRLGPVRSARSTDAQLLPLFGRPGLVYSGANARVQARLDDASIVPIQRTTRDRSRVAPHNVFVDLAALAKSQRRVGDARFIGWTFDKHSAQARSAPRTGQATSRVGNDTFRFDHTDGRYTVRWNGLIYRDGDSGRTSRTDNVVVMRVRDHADGNRDVAGAASVQSDTVGRGKVTVYRDGRRIEGAWARSAPGKPLSFTDTAGDAIALRPGQTWVTLQG